MNVKLIINYLNHLLKQTSQVFSTSLSFIAKVFTKFKMYKIMSLHLRCPIFPGGKVTDAPKIALFWPSVLKQL